jgi:beta-glucanase (GH16 family)
LVWSDDFRGGLDRWGFNVGAGGWGNEELENYTARPQNADVKDGMLNIVVRAGSTIDLVGRRADYTSARLVSKVAFLYGRFEARIKVPIGGGLWPAFWLLGNPASGWPSVGEIDVMEVTGETNVLYTTVWGDTIRGDGWKHSSGLSSEEPWGATWHVYAADWTPDAVVFSVDGKQIYQVARDDLNNDENWAVSVPANIVLNVAVGGFAGPPNASTPFPSTMQVDWVRVYGSTMYERPEPNAVSR